MLVWLLLAQSKYFNATFYYFLTSYNQNIWLKALTSINLFFGTNVQISSIMAAIKQQFRLFLSLHYSRKLHYLIEITLIWPSLSSVIQWVSLIQIILNHSDCSRIFL